MSWTKKRGADLAGEPARVRAAALRYLGRREYTAYELRRRLKERGAADTDIEEALLYVRERGYQDDARAGEIHIRQRINYAPRGRALLRQELRERGLRSELAEGLLDEHFSPEKEAELLTALLAKAGPPPAEAREARKCWQKMARRLTAKGFAQAAVFAALEEWQPEPAEFFD